MARRAKTTAPPQPALNGIAKGAGWYVKWTQSGKQHFVALHRPGRRTQARSTTSAIEARAMFLELQEKATA